jgi:thiamine kinase-like enzyme
VGTLDKVLDRAVRLKVLETRKAFHRTKPLGRKADVFDQIGELLGKCRAVNAPLPEDVAWIASSVNEARDAIRASGIDYVPAHGDGNVSNLMFSESGEVRLIDWDMAGDMDPFLDAGVFLVEAHDSESDAAECFEAFHGRFDRSLFNRAWLYGVADDLRWGLIGALLAGSSRRETYEFLKFGDWRFLRARMAVRDPRFSEKLGRL